jgi:hypothetical protein
MNLSCTALPIIAPCIQPYPSPMTHVLTKICNKLKDLFTTIPILKYFNLTRGVIIKMDTTNFTIGYILL